jgi:hypothetical protein
VIAAQTTPPPQTGTPTTDQKAFVVTGCLKEAPSSPTPSPTATTGTTGTTGAAAGPSDAAPAPKYVLTNATMSTADASGPPAGASTYKLIANTSALTPHLGKKVELTGTLEPAASGNSEANATSDANANGPTLRVQSGKIVGASCSE